MALDHVKDFLNLVPAVRHSPTGYLGSSYDEEGDVLYIHFNKSGHATDSELTEDDIIVRYNGEDVVGITILHASQR